MWQWVRIDIGEAFAGIVMGAVICAMRCVGPVCRSFATMLTRIAMIGNDLALDPGIGTCGKDGQSVPVGVGLPTIRIDELTVGGTQG